MSRAVELISTWIAAITWVCGVVLAHGFWPTLAAVCFPPWALYLVAERLLQTIGWV